MKLKIKNKTKTPDFNEDSFLREISEEIKEENYQKLWKKYGLYIVLFVALVLTITVSFESIKAWRRSGFEKISTQYANAFALENEAKYDESIEAFKKIAEENDGIYASLAAMQVANIYFEQQKVQEGLEELSSVINNKKTDAKVRELAVIKLISYRLDSASAEEIKSYLEPIANSNSAFNVVADEFLALMYIREKNNEEALKIYEKLASMPNAPKDVVARAQDMISVLNNQ